MSSIIDAYLKAAEITKSCKTNDQLLVAKTYWDNFSMLYSNNKDFKYFKPLIQININFKIDELIQSRI